MPYLRYLCLLAYSGVQHILCCVFVLFISSCVPYVASFSGLYIFIAPLVFSNVYIEEETNIEKHMHSKQCYAHHCTITPNCVSEIILIYFIRVKNKF